jgi:hypothetical protein
MMALRERTILIPGLLLAALSFGATPDHYEKQATWTDTVGKYVAAARNQPLLANKPPETAPANILWGGRKPLKLSWGVENQEQLVLQARDAGSGRDRDYAVWADARLIDADGKETWLTDLEPKQVDVGNGEFSSKKWDNNDPAIIGEVKFKRYLLVPAPGTVIYQLDKKYVRFEATVGVEQSKSPGRGSIEFAVSDLLGAAEGTEMAVIRQLIADFPERAVEIMVVRDWYRQAGLDVFSAQNDYETAARTALQQVKTTLAYVLQSGALEKQAAQLQALEADFGRGGDWQQLWIQARVLRRQIIFSHPALDFGQILVNVNPPTRYGHNGDQHLGRYSRVGKGLGVLNNWKTGDIEINYILKGKLPVGAVRNPDLHYDAKRVVFAFCDHTRADEKRYFLYEAALDGSWIRQLTGTNRDPLKTCNDRATVIVEDNDPCYLPDDDLVFISTRCQSFGRCHNGRYNPSLVLHRCDPNGDHIRQLSFGNENEYEPSVLNDGRIIYTRWEYTNRHEMLFHKLWWCRPDGTAPSHYYGNDTMSPMEVVEATAIPGSHKVMATAQGHHSYNTGTTILIDVNKGENGEAPINRLTPETVYSESEGWSDIHYSHPYPVNEELLLVSRANHPACHEPVVPPPNDRGIYLLDPTGGRELIYEDPDCATFSPIAVRTRKRPPVIPSTRPPDARPEATVFLQNAYLTRNDPEGLIKPGMIKAIRINAFGVQPRAVRRIMSKPVPNEIPKKVLGTVPVGADGSAFFKVPANTSLQMQSLDENGMAILTEKSFFYLQPGENSSCIGCHEPQGSSPDMHAMARLSRMKPMELKPQAGPQYKGGLSFMRTVQPVLDRYCIGCHGLGQAPADQREKADRINLILNDDPWPQSYRELVDRGDHQIGEKNYMSGINEERNISRPRRFYAYSNKVAHMLLENHGNCNIDQDSYMRIIEFLDLNAQYYGDLFPNKLEDRQIDQQGFAAVQAFAAQCLGEVFANQPARALINVAQPDESRILMAPLAAEAGGWGQVKGFTDKDDPDYKKMAELVDHCILRDPNENDNGWEPGLAAGGGEDWIITSREQYKAEVGARP